MVFNVNYFFMIIFRKGASIQIEKNNFNNSFMETASFR